MVLHAPAKINLYLRVLGKRKDGYHNVETVFEKISLFDKIIFRSLKKNMIKITCDDPCVPMDKKSLIYKTVKLFKNEFKVKNGVEVRIIKKIPVAAGLGGGSSDAASVLTGLNKLWRLSLNSRELSALGGNLGADIPFFLGKSSFAKGERIGDEITPLNWKIKLWHLLVFFPFKLLSKDIYTAYDKMVSSGLTKKPCINKILPPVVEPSNMLCVNDFISNDLEKIVLEKAPFVARVKKALSQIGIKHSLVSGSGPSVFTIFQRRKEAQAARESLIERFPIVKNEGWQIFIAETL